MRKHGLLKNEWKFQFNRGKRMYGKCDHSVKVISLSNSFATSRNVSRSEIENVVLHEIAHALVGPGHGHGEKWKRMALSIGCDGETYHEDKRIGGYDLVCPCGNAYLRKYRKSVRGSSLICVKCNHYLTYEKVTI
jgi:predicted SprT family Zn-dependent metalloprotease